MPQPMDSTACIVREPIELQPFIHQVGGHTGVLCFNETTLCKPLDSREHYYYTTLPENLKEFTPEYRGVIDVELQEDSNGRVTLVGYLPNYHKTASSLNKGSLNVLSRPASNPTIHNISDPAESCGVHIRRTGSDEVPNPSEKLFHIGGDLSESSSESYNPWSLKCHKRQLAQMKKAKKDLSNCEFILLENVAARFKSPCILDLKMGTRQHGDDAPESKKASQTRKCQATTSALIGLRICGMQIYQVDKGNFICRNKYYGRGLTADGFNEAIYQFFHNGSELKTDILVPIIQRLEQLHAIIEKQEAFRFYSSSLLIMYEGNDTNDTLPEEDDDQPPSASTVRESDNKSHHVTSKSSADPLVEVKMIDFAHSTHRGFEDDSTIHNGPDQGYLFGLEHLINLFKKLLL